MMKTIRNVGRTPVRVVEDLGAQGIRSLFTLKPGEEREMPSGKFQIQGPSGTFVGTDVVELDRPNQCGRYMYVGTMEEPEICLLDRGHQGAHLWEDDQYVVVGPVARVHMEALRKVLRPFTE